jgi:hypothetical protein
MKIYGLFLGFSGVFGAPETRKVPPRTPPQRLDTLKRFWIEYLDENLMPHRPKRVQNQYISVDRTYTKLLEKYEQKNDITGLRSCSYFNDQVPNGGPRPSEDGKKKRSDWVANELCNLGDVSHCSKKRKRKSVAMDLDFDPFDEYEMMLQDGERSAAAFVRLAIEPELAIRQIRTGFQKWILRYMSECYGQTEYAYHSRRLKKVTDNTFSSMRSVEKIADDYDWDAARWEEHSYHPDHADWTK